MTNRLHIVTTCSNRKRVAIRDALRARSLADESVHDRFREWVRRLMLSDDKRFLAGEVYAGEHWQQSQKVRLRAMTSGWDARLWVASAGHGVIGSEHEISGYAATLALRESDAVARTQDEAREWWGRLGGLDRAATSPRHITELVRRDPNARFILILSGSYGAAMSDDLEQAATSMGPAGELIILSGGWSAPATLREAHFSYDARLQGVLGGARQSLNARVAVWLLARTSPQNWGREHLSRLLAELQSQAPELETPVRERLSDREVVDFVRAYLASEQAPSASRALRQLRDTGRACEQRRFSEIYRGVRDD